MDNSNARYKMSAERLEAIKKELNELETVKALEVAEMIKEARSFGDLSENSEYDEAKNEQGKLYSKIAELKDLVDNAEIVEEAEDNAPKDTVTLGSIVTIYDVEMDETETYTIVGSQEANPKLCRLSDDSPIGRALRGHREGDTVEVSAPNGVIEIVIKKVIKD